MEAPESLTGEGVGELETGEGVENIADAEAPAAERASGHRAEGGEPAAIPETPRPAARAERGHDVAAPPPTSPDDIDIVAGGMGALALDDRVSVTNPAGTNSMRGADHEQVLWRVVMEMRVEVTADEYVCRSAAARGCRRRAGAGA